MKIFFAFLLVLIVQFSSNPSVVKGQNLVQETCKKTKYPNVCVSALTPDPRSSSADVKGLAHIALDKVLDKANETLNLYSDLYKNYSSDPSLGRFYGTCLDAYAGSVERLVPEAISSLQSNNYATAENDSENVASNAQLCEQQFDKSPTHEQNTFVQQLSTVAADIISILG